MSPAANGITQTRRILFILAVLFPILASGCGPLVIAGATYGGALLHERRSTQTVLADEQIELQAGHLYFNTEDIKQNSRISITSYNLEVLLTGQARTAAVARRFAEQVARLPKVTKVYNEVEIGPNISLTRQSQDAYLGSRAKLALVNIKLADFDPLRVKVVVDNGVIYLLGLLTPSEAEAVVDKVRRVPGVVRVVQLFNRITTQPAAQHAG